MVKNGYISGLAWALTTRYQGIKGYNVDIIANSEDQAKTSFDDVYEMLDRTWDKSKKFFYKSKELIRNTDTGSYIKYNTSGSKTKDGKRSACLIFDELHEYEDGKVMRTFKSDSGVAGTAGRITLPPTATSVTASSTASSTSRIRCSTASCLARA